MKRMTRVQQRRRKNRIWRIIIVSVILVTLTVLTKNLINNMSRFAKATYIQGIDCSELDVEQAKKKIKNEIENKEIKFVFANGNVYSVIAEQLEPTLDVEFDERLESILKKQPIFRRDDWKYSVSFNDLISFNKNTIRNYLLKLPEFETKISTQENTSIEFDEKSGMYVANVNLNNVSIDIEEATDLAVYSLNHGSNIVDFSELANKRAKELSFKSEQMLKPINNALKTTIVYHINDTTTTILDKQIIKEWIYKDKEGVYRIDVEKKLQEFVYQISQRSQGFDFKANGIGTITIMFSQKDVPEVDEEQEIEWLKQVFGDGKYHERYVSYIKRPPNINLKKYIELDITRQTIWLYENDECLLETPCVTGNVATKNSTPTGLYYLTHKTTDTVLRGKNSDGSRYASHVDYWMAFIKNSIGFHDASWRKGVFGGEIYKTNGSHGCVNVPLDSAKILYENISADMPIIIYKS